MSQRVTFVGHISNARCDGVLYEASMVLAINAHIFQTEEIDQLIFWLIEQRQKLRNNEGSSI